MQARYLFLWMLVFLAGGASAATVDWSDYSHRTPLGRMVSYWQEPLDSSPDLEQIRKLGEDEWTRNRSEKVSLGYGDEAYWFRVGIKNRAERESVTLLEIGYPVLDHVEVYTVRGGELQTHYTLGDKLPFYERPIYHRNFIVPITLPAGSTTEVFLRVDTTSSMQVPLELWSQSAFYAADQPIQVSEGIYYGIVLVMILYNLFVFMAVGERSFLYYVGFIAAMPLFLASLHGLSFQYLWPGATWWNDQAITFFLSLVVLFNCLFTLHFLSIDRTQKPLMGWFLVTAAFAGGGMALLSFFVPYALLILPTIAVAALVCLMSVVISVVRVLQHDLAARYYLIAWVMMLFGGIMLALSKLNILPRNALTENAVQIGSALGVILLSIALADRLNREKRAAFRAQQQLYEEERKARMAQEKSLEIQREANVMLEERVEERTRDLEALNERLRELSATDALTGLKNRGHFDRHFQSTCVKAYRFEQPLSLLIIDIDHFKKFNDTYGHLVGDDCLKMVADSIRQCVTRPQDLAARYGGEEFVVLLPDTPEAGAVRVAENIRSKIEKTDFQIGNQMMNLSVSVGVCSLIPTDADQTKLIFRRADEALYEAKGRGRNRVEALSGGDSQADSADAECGI